MTIQNQDYKAIHLGDGNYFDNMRIDINQSHKAFHNLPRNIRSIKRPKWRNRIKFILTAVSMKYHLRDFLVQNGLSRKWLDEFTPYWTTILNGRPFWNILEFFMLLHDYRKRQQYTSALAWDSPETHIKNWQHPNQLYSTFHNVRELAINPIVCQHLWGHIPYKSYILEYGCSLAPYYYCYRKFFSHLECQWVLADLANFPFHYAKYLYRHDQNLDFVTIEASNFLDPLKTLQGLDVIIVTTVLEHLDNPVFVTNYLLDRLNEGGLFVFDYIKSEGKGLDHPQAVKMRTQCLRNILDRIEIIHGNVEISKRVSLSIGRKKNA